MVTMLLSFSRTRSKHRQNIVVRPCSVLVHLLIFVAVFCGEYVHAQSDTVYDRKIAHLIDQARGYEQVEKLLFLIVWESNLVEEIPCIAPVKSEDFRKIPVSSKYGLRYHPILNEYRHHSGIDIPGQIGDSVFSAAKGIVKEVGCNALLGNYVRIEHRFGFSSLYGHLAKVYIQEQDRVEAGTFIAEMGSTGRSTGPHLHYAITKYGREENAYYYCFLFLKYLHHRSEKISPPSFDH